MNRMSNATSPLQIKSNWATVLDEELQQPYMQELAKFLEEERKKEVNIYPPKHLIFHALEKTPFDRVKVVIVGQDPYHGPGQAHGLSFSVPKGVPLPPSLKNIFKELQRDLNIPQPAHGCLDSWAEQGVLLLNATLTVTEKSPLSHHGIGWERFTDAIISKLWESKTPIIFVLWGKYAQKKLQKVIHCQDDSIHKVLVAAHPSPFSAHQGFFGCSHFSQINHHLSEMEKKPISWNLPC